MQVQTQSKPLIAAISVASCPETLTLMEQAILPERIFSRTLLLRMEWVNS